ILPGKETGGRRPEEAARLRCGQPAGADRFAGFHAHMRSDLFEARRAEYPGPGRRAGGAEERFEHSLRRIAEPSEIGTDELCWLPWRPQNERTRCRPGDRPGSAGTRTGELPAIA